MLETQFQTAQRQLREFLDGFSPAQDHVFVTDVDADGVCAGVVFEAVLSRLGRKNTLVLPDRARNVWTGENREKIAQHAPDALFVLDLGCRDEKVLPKIRTFFLDHHRPEGVPDGDVLVSGYAWEPIPNTSWMAFEIARGWVEIGDLDWVAAIGTLSDLGDGAPWPLLDEARKKYTAKWLKEATALVNAPRRASNFAPEIAVAALRKFSNPKELCNSDAEEVVALKAARREVSAALQEGKKAAPIFAGDVALIRVDSPCQIHPLIAQVWRSRLPKYHVICANLGYVEGRVNFSARSQGEKNVLQRLKSVELDGDEGYFGHGHDHASGGSLPVERWNQLLEKLGFNSSVFA